MTFYPENVLIEIITSLCKDTKTMEAAILALEAYPSIELPEEFGDLIDKDFLKQHFEACETNGRPLHRMELQERLDCIDEVPVVLEGTK